MRASKSVQELHPSTVDIKPINNRQIKSLSSICVTSRTTGYRRYRRQKRTSTQNVKSHPPVMRPAQHSLRQAPFALDEAQQRHGHKPSLCPHRSTHVNCDTGVTHIHKSPREDKQRYHKHSSPASRNRGIPTLPASTT